MVRTRNGTDKGSCDERHGKSCGVPALGESTRYLGLCSSEISSIAEEWLKERGRGSLAIQRIICTSPPGLAEHLQDGVQQSEKRHSRSNTCL